MTAIRINFLTLENAIEQSNRAKGDLDSASLIVSSVKNGLDPSLLTNELITNINTINSKIISVENRITRITNHLNLMIDNYSSLERNSLNKLNSLTNSINIGSKSSSGKISVKSAWKKTNNQLNIDSVSAFFSDVGGTISNKAKSIYDGVTDWMDKSTTSASNFVNAVGCTITSGIKSTYEDMTKLWDSAKTTVSNFVSDVGCTVASVTESAYESMTKWWSGVKEWYYNDALPWLIDLNRKSLEVLESTAATIVLAVTSLVEGVGQFGESLVDFVAILGTAVASIFTGLYDGGQAIYGAITGEEWSSVTKKMWNGTMGFVSEKYVEGWFDLAYEDVAFGRWVKENAYGYETVRSVSSGIGYVAGIVILTIVTFGVGGAAAGGGAAASSATSVMSTTNAMSCVAAVAGVGKGTQNAWADGADLLEGLVTGVASGVWEGVQFWVGSKIGGANVFGKNGLIKAIGSNGTGTKILNSFARVVLDGVDGGVEGIVQPLLSSIYTEGYYDEDGNYVEFTEEDNIVERYFELFNDLGGWSNVATNAAVGSISSTLGEVFDLTKYLKNSEGITSNINIVDSLERFKNARSFVDDTELIAEFGTNEQISKMFTPDELAQRDAYVAAAGPFFSAYERGAKCTFKSVHGELITYDGSNKNSVNYWFQVCKDRFDVYKGMKNINDAIKNMDKIIEKSPPLKEDTILYRGVNSVFFDGSELEITSLKAGDLINDKATLSTSLIKERSYTQNNIMLEILAPEGTKGVYLGKNAREFLLERNTTFRVISDRVELIDGKFVLKVEIVPKNKNIFNLLNLFNLKKTSNLNITAKSNKGTNVVDQMNLRNSIPNEKNRYNNLFNNKKVGIDISNFMDKMNKRGLLTMYDRAIDDIDNLYSKGQGPRLIEHDVSHVERVMLFSMYMGDELKLNSDEMNILVEAAKFHDVGVYNGHSGHAILSAQESLKNLNGKYSDADINKIAAVIEYHEVNELSKSFESILNKYNLIPSNNQYLYDLAKNNSHIQKMLSKISSINYSNNLTTLDFLNVLKQIDDSNFNNILKKYGILDSEYEAIKKIANILKDADALDRTRFKNNLDPSFFRNKGIADDLIKTSYQMQEIRGKISLDNKISSNYFSADQLENIKWYRKVGVPDYVIDHSYSTYNRWPDKNGKAYSNPEKMIGDWMQYSNN